LCIVTFESDETKGARGMEKKKKKDNNQLGWLLNNDLDSHFV
jgi:hypothetical protein